MKLNRDCKIQWPQLGSHKWGLRKSALTFDAIDQLSTICMPSRHFRMKTTSNE